MYDDEEEQDEGPRSSFGTYLAEGDSLFKQSEYKKALESYSLALELKTSDKTCLVARSKCYLKLGDPQKALRDAEDALSEDKEFNKGLYRKAEALYCMGDFEYALMYYHRGHKLRPELDEFRLGIQKAQEAIDNSIGSAAKIKLENKGDLSFFSKQDVMVNKTRGGYLKPVTRAGNNKLKPLANRNKEVKPPPPSKKTVKQLLGELYSDKEYLDKLMDDEDFIRSNQNNQIHELVQGGLDYLETRTEFWRQQKPLYARKKEKAKFKPVGKKKSKANVSKSVLKQLESIDQALSSGDSDHSLRLAQKLLRFVEGVSRAELPTKDEVLASIYSSIGNAYIEMELLSKALRYHEKDLQLSKESNLADGKSRALDNVGRVHARMGNFKKAVECWNEKLPLVKASLESTWLFHEIGRCHLELGNNEKAKDFGQKSLAAGIDCEDQVWQLNATVLIAQSQVKLGDINGASETFSSALELAIILSDSAAQSAISKAIADMKPKSASKSNRGSASASPLYLSQSENGDSSQGDTGARMNAVADLICDTDSLSSRTHTPLEEQEDRNGKQIADDIKSCDFYENSQSDTPDHVNLTEEEMEDSRRDTPDHVNLTEEEMEDARPSSLSDHSDNLQDILDKEDPVGELTQPFQSDDKIENEMKMSIDEAAVNESTELSDTDQEEADSLKQSEHCEEQCEESSIESLESDRNDIEKITDVTIDGEISEVNPEVQNEGDVHTDKEDLRIEEEEKTIIEEYPHNAAATDKYPVLDSKDDEEHSSPPSEKEVDQQDEKSKEISLNIDNDEVNEYNEGMKSDETEDAISGKGSILEKPYVVDEFEPIHHSDQENEHHDIAEEHSPNLENRISNEFTDENLNINSESATLPSDIMTASQEIKTEDLVSSKISSEDINCDASLNNTVSHDISTSSLVSQDESTGNAISQDVGSSSLVLPDQSAGNTISQDVSSTSLVSQDGSTGNTISQDVSSTSLVSQDSSTGNTISQDVSSSSLVSQDKSNGNTISQDVSSLDVTSNISTENVISQDISIESMLSQDISNDNIEPIDTSDFPTTTDGSDMISGVEITESEKSVNQVIIDSGGNDGANDSPCDANSDEESRNGNTANDSSEKLPDNCTENAEKSDALTNEVSEKTVNLSMEDTEKNDTAFN